MTCVCLTVVLLQLLQLILDYRNKLRLYQLTQLSIFSTFDCMFCVDVFCRSDIAEGRYELLLHFPDPYPMLYGVTAYKILAANNGKKAVCVCVCV